MCTKYFISNQMKKITEDYHLKGSLTCIWTLQSRNANQCNLVPWNFTLWSHHCVKFQLCNLKNAFQGWKTHKNECQEIAANTVMLSPWSNIRSAPAGSSVSAQGLTIVYGRPLSRSKSSPYGRTVTMLQNATFANVCIMWPLLLIVSHDW